MSADKYPCIFSPQMEAIVYIFYGTQKEYDTQKVSRVNRPGKWRAKGL